MFVSHVEERLSVTTLITTSNKIIIGDKRLLDDQLLLGPAGPRPARRSNKTKENVIAGPANNARGAWYLASHLFTLDLYLRYHLRIGFYTEKKKRSNFTYTTIQTLFGIKEIVYGVSRREVVVSGIEDGIKRAACGKSHGGGEGGSRGAGQTPDGQAGCRGCVRGLPSLPPHHSTSYHTTHILHHLHHHPPSHPPPSSLLPTRVFRFTSQICQYHRSVRANF